MKDISSMSVTELQEHLEKLRVDLEEVEEERMFVLSQTGLHVSARAVSNFESEMSRLKTEIGEVEKALQDK